MEGVNNKLNLLLNIVIVHSFCLVSLFAQSVEGGYSNKYSVRQGEQINFYISSSAQNDTITIFKIEDVAKFRKEIPNIPFKLQSTRDSSYSFGCGWDSTYILTIDSTYEPGIYRADFKTYKNATTNLGDSTSGILFFVKPTTLGSYSKSLLVVATNTWQAYNDYGGKSLYDNISTNNQRSHKVSFNRPANRPLGTLGSADFYKYERKFLNWTYLNNIPLEFASMYDLDRDANFLSNYDIVYIVGHNEYWTLDERRQLQNFVNGGGKLIILSGNTCWWQVRFEDNGQTMVCYKNKVLDQADNPGIADSLVTVNWWDKPVNNPSEPLFGIDFKFGGYVNSGGILPKAWGYGDYTAFNTHYWIYNGTSLRDGEEFGYKNAIVGYETDGTPTGWDAKGLAVPFGTDTTFTPANYRIFGFSPTKRYDPNLIPDFGHATMGMFYVNNTNKGVVFNGATTDWVDGLFNDPLLGITPDTIVVKITKNIINKFTRNEFPPEITGWSPYKHYVVSRNGEPVHLSIRDTMFNAASLPASVPLSITASNPFVSQGTINYAWLADGQDQFVNNSTFTYTFPQTFAAVKKHTITAYAINNEDTSSISWNFFTQPVVIDSDPPTIVDYNTDYYFKLRTFHLYGDTVQYQFLENPTWLSINADSGIVSGISPTTSGNYSVIIKAIGKNGGTDTLGYTLQVQKLTAIENEKVLPQNFSLSQNYPNPFNPSTVINFDIPVAGFVTLKIYDILGREVRTLLNEEKTAGSYKINFDANGLPSGVYLYRITSGNFAAVKKMILLR